MSLVNQTLLTSFNYDGMVRVTDATYVAPNTYVSTDIPKDIALGIGTWKLTIARPNGSLSSVWKPKDDYFTYFDDNGDFQQKKYTIDKLAYLPTSDELEVTITIHENHPIAIYIVYAAVVAVIGAVIAVSANSVLTKVEQVVTQIPEKLTKSPFAWGILLIFLVPVLVAGYVKFK